MQIKQHLLLYILAPLCVLAIAGSVYRFFVTEDYIVEYETNCDPQDSQCFIGTDTATGEQYFYSLARKHATDLRRQCGVNITDCDLASVCEEGDEDCSITFCTPDAGTCSYQSVLRTQTSTSADSSGVSSMTPEIQPTTTSKP